MEIATQDTTSTAGTSAHRSFIKPAAIVSISAKAQIHFTLTMKNTTPVLDVRIYARRSDGTLVRTLKGFTIRAEHIRKLAAAVLKVVRTADDYGFLEEQKRNGARTSFRKGLRG